MLNRTKKPTKMSPSAQMSPPPPTEQKPFDQAWINSCYQQTLLPNAPWHKLEEEVSHNLAQKAEKQFTHPTRKEMLLELLGRHFVEKYLSHVQRKPELLEHMSAEERNRLRLDAQNWLNSQMYKAVKETGHEHFLTGQNPNAPPPTGNYAEFLRSTFNIFNTGVDRQLHVQEQKLVKEKGLELMALKRAGKEADIYKVPAPSRIKPVGTAISASTQATVMPSSGQLRSMVHTVEGDPPPLWGPQSDAIGAAVVSLLQRDPKKFEVVVGRMHGRQLPGSLRSYIWADVLFKVERKKMKEIYVETIVRERFAIAVTRGLTELKIKKPTQSPINGLIQNAVIETYGKTTSMVPYKQMEHMKETVRALNVLYVYDRSYEPYLIHWLFPLQLAFRNKQAMKDDKGEHVLELAMYLDMLNTSCFPTWPHVFAMAEQVMITLEERDPKLYEHLKRIAPINAQVNPKEFMVQLLHQEREKAEALMKTTNTATPRAPSSSTQFLADPTIFLRRWIGEGFVSILDTPCMMYIWDQLFMQSWSQSAIINVCLSIIELLRHRFMEAHNYLTMKEVFLLEPCKLYTVDVQMAWIHVENGKDLLEINELYNRQRPQSSTSRLSSDLGRESPPDGLLRPCGVKNIRTKINFLAAALEKEPWLSNLKAEDLRLNISVYFGSIKMRSRLSHSLPVIVSSTEDSYGGRVVELEFPGERYIYDMLDISQYDVERELGAYPYAVLKLESSKPRKGKKSVGQIPLGWGRLPLYRQQNQMFILHEGDATVSLHPGDVPESLLSAQPQTPAEEDTEEGSLIGYSCTLSALVFDPNREPQTRAIRTPDSIPPMVPPVDTRPPRQPSPPTLPPPPPTLPPPPRSPVAPVHDPNPWVAFKPAASKSDPKPTTNREPFRLYIDQVRYLPDNATVVKVTGRILRAGNITNLQDILAVPELDSSARSPSFKFHMLVNEARQVADPQLLLFLRVYTYDIELKKIVVVGSCLVPVFNPGKKKGEGFLNVGGHQLRLRSGMPMMREGLNQIEANDLNNNPAIPCSTLLIRLLPGTQDQVLTAPEYSSGYYRSDACKPTGSETRIFDSFAENMGKTESDMIVRTVQAEKGPAISVANHRDWLINKLDIKRQQGASQPAGNLSLLRCVRYRTKVGLMVQIQAATGMPDGMYIQCFARVAPGKQAKYISPTEEGFGREEKFVTSDLNPTSHITAPKWEDYPRELHPFYDHRSCLIIQLIGLKLVYRPRADHKQPGILQRADGRPLIVTEDEVIGWTALPLFDGNAVLSGAHTLPVLTAPLNEEIQEELCANTVDNVLSKRIWNNYTRLDGASVRVLLWDAHYDATELPEAPSHDNLANIVGGVHSGETPQSSQTQQDYVLSMLEEKVRKQGLKGTTFKKEMTFFNELSTKTFRNLMEDYCLNKGYAPLL